MPKTSSNPMACTLPISERSSLRPSSILLAATSTGFPLRRTTSASTRSSTWTPSLPSTTRMATAASASAFSACRRTLEASASASPSRNPPVSTTVKCVPAQSASP